MKEKNRPTDAQVQAGRLAELIAGIVYRFSTHVSEGACCEALSHAELRALRAALHHETCTMREVAVSAGVTKSGATRIVARLAEKGLVDRKHDPADGRICCVALTEKGKGFLVGIEAQLKNDMGTILEGIEPALREILILSLDAFWSSAQKRLPGCGKKIVGGHATEEINCC